MLLIISAIVTLAFFGALFFTRITGTIVLMATALEAIAVILLLLLFLFLLVHHFLNLLLLYYFILCLIIKTR